MNLHEQYLKLLAIFHYIHSGVAAVGILFYALFQMVALGLASMVTINAFHNYTFLTATVLSTLGWTAALLLGLGFLVNIGLVVSLILSGRFMQQRKRYMFCLVIAGIESVIFPVGTVLGIFTLITLTRPQVQRLFGIEQLS
jgi:hypothetical protein